MIMITIMIRIIVMEMIMTPQVMQCTQLRRIELERSFLIDCRCSRFFTRDVSSINKISKSIRKGDNFAQALDRTRTFIKTISSISIAMMTVKLQVL